MSVDVEALTVSFLRGQADVTAIAADRIYSDLPHDRTYPLVLVNRTGGGFLYKNHLEAADLEINAYGGTHRVAYNLAQACMSTMAAGIVGAHTEGTVTKVMVTGLLYNPEPDSTDPSGHARPRCTISATVTAHP